MTLNIDGFINSKGGLLQCWWVRLRIVRLNLELLLRLDSTNNYITHFEKVFRSLPAGLI